MTFLPIMDKLDAEFVQQFQDHNFTLLGKVDFPW